MRYLIWILKFALFVVVLAFAVKNSDPVTVRYYFGGEWQTPLVFALLIAFSAGVAAGLLAGLAQLIRQRREIASLRRELTGQATGREGAAAQGTLPKELQP